MKVNEILAKLTPKQRKFAEGLVYGGLSKAEAYRQAYKWNGISQKSMQVAAVRTAKKSSVDLAVKAMEEERTARLWEDKGKFRDWIMKGITDTANNASSDITRLKALELAGKTRYASLYEEPAANESNAALSGALVSNLEAKLALILQSFSAPISGEEEFSGPILDTTCDPIAPSDTTPTETPTGGGEGE